MTPAGFLLLLLSLPVILVQEVTYTSTQVCAPKGSSVDLKCSYTDPPGRNPLERPIWSRPDSPGGLVDLRTDWEYRGRVQYPNDGKDCTLRITDLRERDAAVYSFRSKTQSPGGSPAGPPGVTLNITDLQVKVINTFYNQGSYWVNMSCDSPGCPDPDPDPGPGPGPGPGPDPGPGPGPGPDPDPDPGPSPGPGPPSYVWYLNGEKRSEDSSPVTVPLDWTDSYSCALKGFEEFPSPPECLGGESCYKVTYDVRSVCAVKGSSVNISSRYYSPYPVTSKSWFRSDRSPEDLSEDTHYKGRVEVIDEIVWTQGWRGSSILRISDLRLSDSADYRFTFTSDLLFKWGRSLAGTRLTVTDLQVKISSSSSSSNGVNLECISSCRLPDGSSFVWFKNGAVYEETKSSSLQVSSDLEGFISCAVSGLEKFPSPPLYGPKSPSVSLSPSGVLLEGTSVTLSCSSDANPAASYTWYKEDQQFSEGSQLVFRSIQSSDSGLYHCLAENQLGTRKSEPVSVNVEYGPKSPSVSLSPSGVLLEFTSVTLICSSDANPAASYTWYKENQTLLDGADGRYHFTSISSEDGGMYHCKAENQHGESNSSSLFLDVQYNPTKMINIIRLCVVPLIPVPLLLFHLWLRKKYSLSSISEAGGRVESVELHSRRPPPPQAEEEEGYELVE